MNPWIRRLAMMMGILVPGLLMIFLQVDPVLLFVVLGLGAVAILFAAGSVTLGDLKGLRRGAPKKPAGQPAGAAKPAGARPQKQPAAKISLFRALPSALRDLAGIITGRRLTKREQESRIDAIDRVLDRTIPRTSGRTPAATVRRPVPGGGGGGSEGSSGDPFLDLLDATFEPSLADEEPLGKNGSGPMSPLIRGTGAGKEEQAKGPAAAAAQGATAVPAAGTFDIQFENIDDLPRSIPAIESTGGTPAGPAGRTAVPLVTVPAAPETKPAVTAQEVKAPGKVGTQELISFAGPGGSMDDLLAALKADSVRVKRSDDSSLFRNLKGIRVQGEELVDELSTLLKKLRK